MEKGILNLYPSWDSPPKSTIFHRDSLELSIFSRQHQINFYEALDYYESSDRDQIYGVLIPQWFSMPSLTVTTSLLHVAHISFRRLEPFSYGISNFQHHISQSGEFGVV